MDDQSKRELIHQKRIKLEQQLAEMVVEMKAASSMAIVAFQNFQRAISDCQRVDQAMQALGRAVKR